MLKLHEVLREDPTHGLHEVRTGCTRSPVANPVASYVLATLC